MYKTRKQHKSRMLELKADKLLKDTIIKNNKKYENKIRKS